MSTPTSAQATTTPSHTASQFGLLAAIVVFAALAPSVLMTAPAIAGQLASQWQLSPGQIGNLFASELAAMSLATLPAYWWLPRSNWRRAALLAGLVFISANLASSLVSDYYSLMSARVASGLAGGSLMILCISCAASTANRDRVYGLWVMGQLILGAAGLAVLPTLFEHHGLEACYLILAGLMACCLPLARAFPAGAMPPQARQQARPFPRLLASLGILAVLTFYISISGIWTFIGAIAGAAGINAQASGEILATATLLGILGAATASTIGNRFARRPLLLLGYALLLAGTLLLLDQPGQIRFVIAALMFKFTWTFVLPFILASLAELDSSGRLMNTVNLVIGGGLAIGPALAGQLIERSGTFSGLLVGGAVAASLSLALMLVVNRRPRDAA